MKKIVINLIYICLICIVCVEVLINSKVVLNSVRVSFSIWQNNIFPSLFPFFIIGNMLICLGFPSILGELFKNITYKLFKINKNGAFIIILSMLSGFPSSAKYIKEIYLNGDINEKEATKLLMFTHFSNPLFVLGTVSLVFLNNSKIGIPILISHYLGNLVIGLIVRNYYVSKKDNSKINIKNSLENINNSKSFGQILSNSISSGINTLLLILGTISVFLILTSLINTIFNFSDLTKTFVNGIFEMTQGLKCLESLSINTNIKGLIAVIILSFGGLSVHMQTLTIISDTKIKYFPYFISRIFHALISACIFYLWKVF